MFVHNSEHNSPINSDHDDDIHDSVTRISKLDISDPLHLHPNDSTAFIVVSIKLKGIKNDQFVIMSVYNSEHNTPLNFDHDDDIHDSITSISKLDISDPLYLHPNDTFALTVVSIKLKRTENYQVWSCAMLLALEGKNKIGFIDRSCKRSKLPNLVLVLGLDYTYMQIRGSILFRETLPDVRSTYATISSEESHRVVVGSIAG
ncbi:ribonuclease H-like domain-containing protein, partial [Tanacetum coccineum]